MVCLGVKPRAAGWKAQTNPMSYGGTLGLPKFIDVFMGLLRKVGVDLN